MSRREEILRQIEVYMDAVEHIHIEMDAFEDSDKLWEELEYYEYRVEELEAELEGLNDEENE